MFKLGFIGAGTIGSSLALKLSKQGYPVVAVSSRLHTSAKKLARLIIGCSAATDNQEVANVADFVFITTPDGVIASVVSQVAWHQGQIVVHCSGADSTDILEPARKAGAYVGAFHPLQTFASTREAIENLPGSTFTLEAMEPPLGILQEMASALGGSWIKLKAGDKAVYHAAAVIASNYLVTLVKMATDLWHTFGVPREKATDALLPLIRGTVRNVATIGLPYCLTGPIARGDSATVKKHLDTLKEAAPDMLTTYKELGLKTIPIALAKGSIDEHQAAEIKTIIDQRSCKTADKRL